VEPRPSGGVNGRAVWDDAGMESSDWEARSRREAAAIIQETGAYGLDYKLLMDFMAIAWLQGANYGSHNTLHKAEAAFQRLQEDLR